MLETFEIIADSLLQIFLAYVAYRFYASYATSKERVFLVLAGSYTIFFLVLLPYLVLHHFLGYPFAYSELLHELMFFFATAVLAWAVIPRKGWKSEISNERERKAA